MFKKLCLTIPLIVLLPVSCFAVANSFTLHIINKSTFDVSALQLSHCQVDLNPQSTWSNTDVVLGLDQSNGQLTTVNLRLWPSQPVGPGLQGGVKCLDPQTGKSFEMTISIPSKLRGQESVFDITYPNRQINVLSKTYSDNQSFIILKSATAEILQ